MRPAWTHNPHRDCQQMVAEIHLFTIKKPGMCVGLHAWLFFFFFEILFPTKIRQHKETEPNFYFALEVCVNFLKINIHCSSAVLCLGRSVMGNKASMAGGANQRRDLVVGHTVTCLWLDRTRELKITTEENNAECEIVKPRDRAGVPGLVAVFIFLGWIVLFWFL